MTASSPTAAVTSINGRMIRAYRKRLGLKQSEFAELAGVTQAALSLWESGKASVSESSAERMAAAFGAGQHKPSIHEFMRDFEERGGASAALVGAGTFTTLFVWDWTPDLDLDVDPASMRPTGIVSLRLPPAAQAVALELPSHRRHQPGEVMVFIKLERAKVAGGDICLLWLRPKVGATRTMVVAVEGRSHASQSWKPLFPRGKQALNVDESEVFRCVYRGRYV